MSVARTTLPAFQSGFQFNRKAEVFSERKCCTVDKFCFEIYILSNGSTEMYSGTVALSPNISFSEMSRDIGIFVQKCFYKALCK